VASGRWRSALFVALTLSCSGKSTVIPAPSDEIPNDPSVDPNSDPDPDPDPDPEDAGPPRVCATTTLRSAPPRTLGIELVVPTTAAMNAELPGDTRTRFESVHSSIVTLIERLDPWHRVGLVLTPTDDSCLGTSSLPPTPLEEGRDQLLSVLGSVGEPTGSASVRSAFAQAVVDIELVGRDAERVIVMFLDGSTGSAIPCFEERWVEYLVRDLKAAYESGVQTYLVVTPGSAPSGLATDLAAGYGCPECVLDFGTEPDFAPLLEEVLSPIRAVDVACDFPLPTLPMDARLDLGSVEVTVTFGNQEPVTLLRVVECEAGVGYQIVEGPRIVLCPTSCYEITSALDMSMRIDACSKP
jgi:hypothetical protein